MNKENSVVSSQHSGVGSQHSGDGSQHSGAARGAQSFEQLTVWQRAHELVLQVYRTTARFPDDERFGLTSQMRRAAVSVPANIAEGFRKRGTRDKLNFYNIAQGSLEEVRYYIILARDLRYSIPADDALARVDEIGRMLHALIEVIRTRTAPERR